ncbi:hypothetical protein IFM12275_68900 [Nocardia sputorum]|nr:hypothetical protein IFM12275_68810 [Nocardia sputorum]BDT96914.1 hypothetical protein IFM12275_68900 [Nocardia sputorum]
MTVANNSSAAARWIRPDGRRANRAAGGHSEGAPSFGCAAEGRSNDDPHGASVVDQAERRAVELMRELHAEGRHCARPATG